MPVIASTPFHEWPRQERFAVRLVDCFRPSRQRRKFEIKIIARIREVDSGRAIVRASRIILEKVGRFVVTALNRRTVRLGVESESPDLPFLGVMVKEVT